MYLHFEISIKDNPKFARKWDPINHECKKQATRSFVRVMKSSLIRDFVYNDMLKKLHEN